jgi:2-polyprenyl-3-methyl-5-hydroxy-6-metoxy-1,4-benzoquinol methylase
MIKKIFFLFFANKTILRILLKLHSFSYRMSGSIAAAINNGVHPKHEIVQYKEWFLGNIQPGWVVLDVGCNTGMMPLLMSQKAKFVYGIEIDCKLLHDAKKRTRHENVEFICADATDFDYSPLQCIDCVTLSNVLEHIDHRVDFLKKIINQIKWNNKKIILIRVPMLDREWIASYKKEMGLEWRLDKTHFTEYTFIQFEKELYDASLEIVSFQIKWGELYAVCESAD